MWALTSSLTIVVGLVVGAGYPGDRARSERYQSADVELVRGVVEEKRTHRPRRGRADRYVHFRLLEPSTARASGVVEIEGPSPVYDALRPGMEARFGVYGRLVTRVVVDGVGAAETVESPATAPGRDASVAVVAVPSGGLGLWAAFRLRRRSGSWRRATAFERRRATPWAIAFFAWVGFCFGAMMTPRDLGELFAQGFVTGTAGAVLGSLVYALVRRRQPPADEVA